MAVAVVVVALALALMVAAAAVVAMVVAAAVVAMVVVVVVNLSSPTGCVSSLSAPAKPGVLTPGFLVDFGLKLPCPCPFSPSHMLLANNLTFLS